MLHRTTRLAAALSQVTDELTDADLLARFAAERDHGAFELLVWRHAGMVLGVCRTLLRDSHAAEDAAQAVFLSLARQARAVGRDGSAAGWLFRVARRIASRASRQHAPATAADLDRLPAPDPRPIPDRELELALHQELDRLPESHRAVVLLCFFEGLTHTAAARRLGVPSGTVAGRLARAKEALASRLRRRGLVPSLLAPAAAAVAPAFASATAHAAVALAGGSAPVASEPVLALVRQELRMSLTKKVLACCTALAVACGCLAFGVRSGAEPPPPQSLPVLMHANRAPVPKPPAAVVSKSFAVAPVNTGLQRRLLSDSSPKSAVVMFVNGDSLFKDPKTLDVEALHLSELRKALKGFPIEKGESVAHLQVQYRSRPTSFAGTEILNLVFEGTVRGLGLVPNASPASHGKFFVSTVSHDESFVFDEFVKPLKSEEGADLAETGAGDKVAVAYPVRTPLSRVLASSADGVVDVLSALDGTDDMVPGEVDKSVRAAIEKLKLAKGQRVKFLLNVPGSKRNNQTSDNIATICKRWATDAGLELGGTNF